MPSGYTAKIKDGISFEEFALDCARNFGACITLRDEPGGGEAIPDEFFPSNYHAKKIVELQNKLDKLESLTEIERQSENIYEYTLIEENKIISIEKAKELRKKYERMLEKVWAWKPPTKDHDGLKEFMINQIKESIAWDCRIPPEMEIEEKMVDTNTWYTTKRNSILEDIKYHQDAYTKEILSVRERNKWVADLRRSLK